MRTSILIIFIILCASLLWFANFKDWINLCDGDGKLYSEALQNSLLAGFLAIAGFLLSTKTFILVHMKKEVFDTDDWRKEDLNLRLTAGRVSDFYKSLQQLADFLSKSVIISLLSALLHLLTVFYQNEYSVSIALSSSIIAIILVGWSWYLISENLKVWFTTLNKKEKIRIDSKIKPAGSTEASNCKNTN